MAEKLPLGHEFDGRDFDDYCWFHDTVFGNGDCGRPESAHLPSEPSEAKVIEHEFCRNPFVSASDDRCGFVTARNADEEAIAWCRRPRSEHRSSPGEVVPAPPVFAPAFTEYVRRPATPEAAPSETSSSARTTLRTKLSEAEANLAAVHHVLGESEHSDDSTLAEGVSLRLRELEAKLAQAEKDRDELGEYRTSWQKSSMDAQRKLYEVKVECDKQRTLVTSLMEALARIAEPDQEPLRKAAETGDHLRIIQAVTHALNWCRDIATEALSQAREKGAP